MWSKSLSWTSGTRQCTTLVFSAEETWLYVIAWHWSESWNLTKDRDTRRYETAPDLYLYLLDLPWPWLSKSLSFGSPAAAIFPTSSGQFLLREFDSNGCPCQNFVDVCSMFCQATILIFIILYISLSVLSSLLALRSKSDLQCFFNKFKLRSVLFWNKDLRVLASSWKDSSFSKVILARRGIFDTGTTRSLYASPPVFWFMLSHHC